VALADALKDAPGSVVARRLWLQSGLVIAQIALTVPARLGMGALLLEMRSDLYKMPLQPSSIASWTSASTAIPATKPRAWIVNQR